MKVWVYPEKQMVEFGAERWVCEWHEVKKGAPEPGTDEFEPDKHVTCRATAHKAKEAALKQARKMQSESYWPVTVNLQRVDWYVEEDRVAEWVNVGEPEYLEGE